MTKAASNNKEKPAKSVKSGPHVNPAFKEWCLDFVWKEYNALKKKEEKNDGTQLPRDTVKTLLESTREKYNAPWLTRSTFYNYVKKMKAAELKGESTKLQWSDAIGNVATTASTMLMLSAGSTQTAPAFNDSDPTPPPEATTDTTENSTSSGNQPKVTSSTKQALADCMARDKAMHEATIQYARVKDLAKSNNTQAPHKALAYIIQAAMLKYKVPPHMCIKANTIRSRVKAHNFKQVVKRGGGSPMEEIEPQLVALIEQLTAMQQPISVSDGLALANMVVKNTSTEQAIRKWKERHCAAYRAGKDTAILGKNYWYGFLKRHKHLVVKSGKVVKVGNRVGGGIGVILGSGIVGGFGGPVAGVAPGGVGDRLRDLVVGGVGNLVGPPVPAVEEVALGVNI